VLINGIERNIAPDADLHGANLSDADLRGANLSGANLHGANLSDADLRGANLSGANLSGAYLRGADLSGAYLSGANLRGANLHYADLSDADLSDADLRGANLSGANLSGAKNIPALAAAQLSILPGGDLIGWKTCKYGVIVKLSIPADVRRSNATGRKCRAESAVVLEVIGAGIAHSSWDSSFTYAAGQTVSVPDFDTDRWNECAPGIHFFLTREEAENY
jgi:uncharacterized protein YjbI with pentapeptide repeats